MRYLTPNELLNVLAVAKKKGSREHCMFLLAYKKGLRASELTHLTLSDVADNQIDVRRLKGSKHTVQPLTENPNELLDEKRALATWLRVRGDADGSQMLFTTRQGGGMTRQNALSLFKKVAAKAGVAKDKRFLHICKHSLATHLIHNGANVAYVQQALGHKDPKSTLCYTHISDEQAGSMVEKFMGQIYGGAA